MRLQLYSVIMVIMTNACYTIIATGCPDGSQPTGCVFHPCHRQRARCPAIEDAICIADHCGCKAKWILNGMDVTKYCRGEILL